MIDTTTPILHVTTVHQPLDTRIFQKEVKSLAASGYDVRLATTVDKEQRRDGVTFLPLGAKKTRLRRLTRGVRALATILTQRAGIVHIHDPELLLVAALPALAGVRVVYDVHEFYTASFRASSRSGPMRRFMARAYDLVERLVLPHFAGIVIVSEEMRARYREFVGDERVALVRNFPNLDASMLAQARRQPHPLGGKPYVVHTGGVTKMRAFDDLIEAASQLRRAGVDLTIVNLGGTADYTSDELNDALARANEAGVLVKGAVPYDEALLWLAHARVGYLPLLDTENNRLGMPNKLFEYALFGLPVVAANLGRVAEIVNESGAGVLVEVGDGAGHAKALAAVAQDDELHARLSAAARIAGERYSFDGEFERLRGLYDAIVPDEAPAASAALHQN